MNDTDTGAKGRRERAGAGLARLALAMGSICGAAAILAGPGHRAEWLSLSAGLQTIRWAAIGAIAGAVLAMVSLGLHGLAGARRGWSLAVAALVLNAIVAAPPLYLYSQAQRLPRIHDVSTDTDDPPTFVAVTALRAGARNPVDYKPEAAAQQKRGYPDIVPLRLDTTPAQSFERAERVARSMGWQVVSVVPEELRIEATDTTLLFGFKDDVVIRIRPLAQGSVVDVRSLSRVGGSDFGANAKRVRAFLRKLSAE